jgi:hypothetical protein
MPWFRAAEEVAVLLKVPKSWVEKHRPFPGTSVRTSKLFFPMKL